MLAAKLVIGLSINPLKEEQQQQHNKSAKKLMLFIIHN